MAVRFLGSTSAAVVGAGATLAVPSQDSLKPGDLLFAFFVVQNFTASVLTPPAGWVVEPSPQSIGDQIMFSALHYVGESAEPATYAFAYAASRSIDAVCLAYRGVKQDVLFDPVNYPFGYYAPGGSTGTANKQTGVTSVSTPSSGSASFKPWSRVLYAFGATHASLDPDISDPIPFGAIRARVHQAKASLMVVDALQQLPRLSPVPTRLSNAAVTLAGSIGFVRVLEPIVEANDSYDTYKAKVMRGMISPPFDPSYGKLTGQILTAIGGQDNDIGGLFGDADFLPDEV